MNELKVVVGAIFGLAALITALILIKGRTRRDRFIKLKTTTETCHYCDCEIDPNDMRNTYVEQWDEFVCDNPDCLLRLMESNASE